MPVMDGLKAAKQIIKFQQSKSQNSFLCAPIIAVTAYDDSDTFL